MICADLHRFVDGELSDDDAEAYRHHLAGCGPCHAELPRVIALAERLADDLDGGSGVSTAAPPPPPAPVLAGRPEATVISLATRRRRPGFLALLGLGGLAAAAALVVVVATRRDDRPTAPPVIARLLDDGQPRPAIARFAHPAIDEYRPYQPVRAAGPNAGISLATLARLEATGDWHGLAIAAGLSGNRAQSEAAWAKAGPSERTALDRAALRLATEELDHDGLADVLAVFDDALARQPDHPVALWNRAHALARLGLPLAAATAFEVAAQVGGAGWSEEAAGQAAALRQDAVSGEHAWQADWQAGRALVADGTMPALERVRARPGLFRLMFYDAVRAAPTVEQVTALRPMAIELDQIAGGSALATYVDRIAALSPAAMARRRPLSARYRALAVTGGLSPEATTVLLRDLTRAGALTDDLALGSLVLTGRVAADLERYLRLVAASGDPWFAALGEQHRAAAASARGDDRAAEQILRRAAAAATDARVFYRAEQLELELARLYLRLDRLHEAATYAHQAWARAVAAGESARVNNALPIRGQIALRRFQLSAARGFFQEQAARSTSADCSTAYHANVMLAQTEILRGDPRAARAALDAAPPCPYYAGDLASLAVRLSLWRRAPDPATAEALAADLAAATPNGDGVATVQAETLAGALEIERDRGGGQAILLQAVARADRLAAGPDAQSAAERLRGWAQTLLAIDAARHGDHAGALDAVAKGKRLATPATCVLAVAVDDERMVAIARDRKGGLHGHYDAAWPFPNAAPPPGRALVPPGLVSALADCAQVGVIAVAPLEGTAELLPSTIAWAYLAPPRALPATAAPPRRVRVSAPAAPPDLGLAPLPPVGRASDGVDVDLRGRDATPSRVLAEATIATELELHAHGLRDRRHSDASYLALAPDADGDFALTPARVDGLRLRGAPIVTLAGCGSGGGEPYLHLRDSLPAAFLRAGARAVLATADTIPDDEATQFFAAVRARAAAGGSLAIALRDERLAWMQRDAASWTRTVHLYQ
jgi:hypothetical protein